MNAKDFIVVAIVFSSGRLLVGLRWWNYVDEEGVSHWVYESRKVNSNVIIYLYSSLVLFYSTVSCPKLWNLLLSYAIALLCQLFQPHP